MESAFGIDHGDVSKAMKPPKEAALMRVNRAAGDKGMTRAGNYAGHKVGAKRWGSEKGRLVAQGKTGNPTGYYIDGPTSGRFGRDQLSDLNGKKSNRRLP